VAGAVVAREKSVQAAAPPAANRQPTRCKQLAPFTPYTPPPQPPNPQPRSGFMPYTKISPSRLAPGHKGDLSYLVGQKVKACIVQVDTQSAREELVLSERQAAAAEAMGKLSEGEVVRGEVVRLEDYGAILALLGADGGQMGLQGLVHKKELSWDVVMTVDDVLKLGGLVVGWSGVRGGGGLRGECRG